jgi:hypothetical protein
MIFTEHWEDTNAVLEGCIGEHFRFFRKESSSSTSGYFRTKGKQIPTYICLRHVRCKNLLKFNLKKQTTQI